MVHRPIDKLPLGTDLPRLMPNLTIVGKDGAVIYRGNRIASTIGLPPEERSIQEQMRDCFAVIATICAPDKLTFVHDQFCIIFFSLIFFFFSYLHYQ